MRYQKKNFWSMALAGVLATAFIGGCPKQEETPPPKKPDKTVHVREWKKIDPEAEIRFLAASKEDTHLYAAGRGQNQLYYSSSTDPDRIELEKIDLSKKTGLSNVRGKADLVGVTAAIKRLQGTEDGVLLSFVRKGNDGGAAYLEGSVFKGVWIANRGKGQYTDLAVDITANIIFAGVLKKDDGSEYVYINNPNPTSPLIGKSELKANSTSDMPLASMAATEPKADIRLKVNYKRTPPFDVDEPTPHFFVNVDDNAYIVDKSGFNLVNDDDIGTEKVSSPPAGGTSSDNWKLPVSGDKKNEINDVTSDGKRAFVAHPNGVVIFDGKNTIGPDNSWTDVSVFTVITEGQNIWAVAKNGLFKVETKEGKTTKGKKFTTSGLPADYTDYNKAIDKASYDEGDVSTEINADDTTFNYAIVNKGNLFIATNKGILVRKAAARSETIKAPAPK
jgi:hypothetical protein